MPRIGDLYDSRRDVAAECLTGLVLGGVIGGRGSLRVGADQARSHHQRERAQIPRLVFSAVPVDRAPAGIQRDPVTVGAKGLGAVQHGRPPFEAEFHADDALGAEVFSYAKV